MRESGFVARKFLHYVKNIHIRYEPKYRASAKPSPFPPDFRLLVERVRDAAEASNLVDGFMSLRIIQLLRDLACAGIHAMEQRLHGSETPPSALRSGFAESELMTCPRRSERTPAGLSEREAV